MTIQDKSQKSIEEFSKSLEKYYGEGFTVGAGTVPTQGPITSKETIKEFIKKGPQIFVLHDEQRA